MSEILYKRILRDLKGHSDSNIAQKDQKYHKYEGYRMYGIRAPIFRKLCRNYKKEISSLSFQDSQDLALKFYKSKIEEGVLIGNYILSLHVDTFKPKDLSFIDNILKYLMSWSTVDDFCMLVLQPILLKYPNETLNYTKKWNQSKHIWTKRVSIVVFTRKVGETSQFTDYCLQLCENLIEDPEDLIQKAIGWALKDSMRGNKKKVLDYVKQLRKRGVSSVITLYAIRDLKGKEREFVLKIKVAK